MAEFNLSYTAEDINTKLGKIDTLEQDVNKLNNEKVDKTGISLGIGADGLIYIHVNGAPVGAGIAQGASGDVIGYVDADNNIILTGALASGTYTVKYELEDGTMVDIGEMSFEEDVEIINQISISTDENGNLLVGANGEKGYLTNSRISSSDTSGNVQTTQGVEVTGFIPFKYGDLLRGNAHIFSSIDNDGSDIFKNSTAYNNITCFDINKNRVGSIKFDLRNDNIVAGLTVNIDSSFVFDSLANGNVPLTTEYIRVSLINITNTSVLVVDKSDNIELPDVSQPTGNLADPTSSDWADGYRISSSSDTGLKAVDGFVTTNFIPAKSGDILRIKGIDITHMITGNYSTVASYKNDKTISVVLYTGTTVSTSPGQGAKDVVSVNGDVCTYTILLLGDGTQQSKDYDEYIRITGKYMNGYTAEDVVITINEEILDDDTGDSDSGNYTNLVPTSMDADGSVFNGVGFADDVRANSSGGTTALTGAATTGWMPIDLKTDTIRIKGVDRTQSVSDSNYTYFVLCNKSYTVLGFGKAGGRQNLTIGYTNSGWPVVDSNGVELFYSPDGTGSISLDESTSDYSNMLNNVKYFRITGKGSGADMIITKNEEIN